MSIRTDIPVQHFEQMLRSYVVRWTTFPDGNITCYDDYTDEDRGHIGIVRNMIYRHKKLNIKYNTYDMQEGEDVIYPKGNPGIMVLSSGGDHPYLYGRVLDLFHIEAINYRKGSIFGMEPCRLEMVWVQWYELDQKHEHSGFNSLQYPSLSLYEDVDGDAYGLVHPDEIIRRVHLIPNFNVLTPGMEDYERVQVNMFVAFQRSFYFISLINCPKLS